MPIKLNPDRHKAGLRYFTVYNDYSSINIDNRNNVFQYGNEWKTIIIISRAYKITQIDAEIKRQMGDNEAVYIIARPKIIRLGINILRDDFQVDRNIDKTITNFLDLTTPLFFERGCEAPEREHFKW